MFQRRMIIVASQLRNAQLSPPQCFRRRKPHQQDDEDERRPTIDAQLQSIRNLNKRKHRLSITEGLESATTSTIPILRCLKKNRMSLSFILYVVIGTLFYSLEHNNRQSAILGFYEAITIGYSVGLGPKDLNYEPNPWFSSAYILTGAALIAIILTRIGGKVEETSSMKMFEALKDREDYEHQASLYYSLIHCLKQPTLHSSLIV